MKNDSVLRSLRSFAALAVIAAALLVASIAAAQEPPATEPPAPAAEPAPAPQPTPTEPPAGQQPAPADAPSPSEQPAEPVPAEPAPAQPPAEPKPVEPPAAVPKGPNIIWIVADDLSPRLGCYGDTLAITPNLDRFAAQGARFTRAFSHAPVCSPARSGLITGRYPTTIGTHHHRSKLKEPPELFTQHLQKAGYFVAWPGKTDFNFDLPANAFSTTDNWAAGDAKIELKQPFFAYYNLDITHESTIRASDEEHAKRTAMLRPEQRQDPAKVVLPPYYPDTPEVRRDVARHYETITAMDAEFGRILKKIDDSGLADNTLVIFFSDHGWGMPRGKRWLYDSGIHIPLLARWPGKVVPGEINDDLISLVDFAPTMLALADIAVPPTMQGNILLGERAKKRDYVFAARDRTDETYDRIRAVRDGRFKYIRNFSPELPYAQPIRYMDHMPTMQAWRAAAAAGTLSGPSALFFAPTKPVDELYDTHADPHEINNLAAAPEHAETLTRMRNVLDQWMKETKDLGEFPEQQLIDRGLLQPSTEQQPPLPPAPVPTTQPTG